MYFCISKNREEMDFTPIARLIFNPIARRTDKWATESAAIQRRQLRRLLSLAADTEYGRRYGFAEMASMENPYPEYCRRVPLVEYEDLRPDVMRMVRGEKNVLWPGRCFNFAQSSGTSGGRSKFIPITNRALSHCHYQGAADCMAHYLRANKKSKIFSGKGFILGGSFSSRLHPADPRVKIGDLSATLINKINPLAGAFRIPSKRIALLPEWDKKLPELVKASKSRNVTNISGVPSWFLTVIREVMKARNAEKISDVWPNLEVFFHGGISFEPYREIYREITDDGKMHFMETYNASEGFFAVQNELNQRGMLLIIDNDVFYEFMEIGENSNLTPLTIEDLRVDGVYEMIITSSNGLWRYRLGDTVKVVSLNPVKIVLSGRTKSFINAFGEELMEENAERAIAEASLQTGAEVANYTAAPVFATGKSKGRHQWIIEWISPPDSLDKFAELLDSNLKELNSDYAAKREGTIFLDPPEVTVVPNGTFDAWLTHVGNGKLGGQRKIPRLSNDRHIVDEIISIL